MEGEAAGDHPVQQTAEAEQVAAGIERVTGGLFGRHEGGSAYDDAGLGELRLVGFDASQAEVENLDAGTML